MSISDNWTRRAFLAATTTTALGLAGGAFGQKPNTARVVPRKISPNEKINIAAIGAGGKGLSDIMGCDHENIVALCDPDWERAKEGFYRVGKLNDKRGNPAAKHYKDYRVMLEEMGDDIDACTISTPDHTHAPAADMAMRLGMHVYVQKPMTHTIAEARYLTKLAEETGVVTMMGNQGHCGDGVRELCEMLWDGAIGDVQECHIWTNRPIWPQGIPNALPGKDVPDEMDWDLWIGSAPMRDYNPGYAPFNWRGWWDFGCGAIGDMACHIMDPAFWSLKLIEADHFTVEAIYHEEMNNQTAPTKSKVKFEFPARADMPPVTVYWYDGGLLPERPEGVPADEELGEGDNGSLLIGTEGALTTGTYGGGSRIVPSEKMKDYKYPAQTIERIKGEDPYREWTNAIHEGRKAVSDFSYAGKLTEVANFGNVALMSGKKLEWDVEKFEITNDKAANQLLTKEYRTGWELPLSDYVEIKA